MARTAVDGMCLVGHGSSPTSSRSQQREESSAASKPMRGAFSRLAPGRQTPLPTRIQTQVKPDDKVVCELNWSKWIGSRLEHGRGVLLNFKRVWSTPETAPPLSTLGQMTPAGRCSGGVCSRHLPSRPAHVSTNHMHRLDRGVRRERSWPFTAFFIDRRTTSSRHKMKHLNSFATYTSIRSSMPSPVIGKSTISRRSSSPH